MTKTKLDELKEQQDEILKTLNEFFKEPKERLKDIVSKHGKDRVYENIEACGGIKMSPHNPRSREVAIPIDSEDMNGNNLFLDISTSLNGDCYKLPLIYKWRNKGYGFTNHAGYFSFHPYYIPEEQRELYRKILLKRLEKLDKSLSNQKSFEIEAEIKTLIEYAKEFNIAEKVGLIKTF